MTVEEAIARIKVHKIIHKMDEPRAIYISEALDMAIKALEQESVLNKIRAEVLEYIDDLDIAAEILAIFDKYDVESEG